MKRKEGTVRVQQINQNGVLVVTIPGKIRDELGIGKHDEMAVTLDGDRIAYEKVRP